MGNIGETMSAFTSLASGTLAISDGNTAEKHALTEFADIDMTGKTISCMVCLYLIRTATSDTYGADAKLLEIDLHYQLDSNGSTEEYTK